MKQSKNEIYYDIRTVSKGLYTPPALGVTGDVMLEAVLLYLQHMVKGAIQLLHCHLNGTLQTSEAS